MNKTAHRIYIGTMALIVVFVTVYLAVFGKSYYNTTIEERFYHADHKLLKPSGAVGHGLGILGTVLMLIGVFGYQARKYMKSLSKVWILKHWLEFHIFLCTLGPIMVLFHTSFKFGGLVSISFWSMVAVVASGVVGRFIYLQIPRTIHGRELSLYEIKEMRTSMTDKIQNEIGIERLSKMMRLKADAARRSNIFSQYFMDWQLKRNIKKQLINSELEPNKIKNVLFLVDEELNIGRKIERLIMMQKMFRYWHVVHLPFAIIMLVIMFVHVAVTLTFGYKWVF